MNASLSGKSKSGSPPLLTINLTQPAMPRRRRPGREFLRFHNNITNAAVTKRMRARAARMAEWRAKKQEQMWDRWDHTQRTRERLNKTCKPRENITDDDRDPVSLRKSRNGSEEDEDTISVNSEDYETDLLDRTYSEEQKIQIIFSNHFRFAIGQCPFVVCAFDRQIVNELLGDEAEFAEATRTTRAHCTVCDKHLGAAPWAVFDRYIHPVLNTLLCKGCYAFYHAGEFTKDEDGSEIYCKWCAQGGTVMCCSQCPLVFCKSCVRQNLGDKAMEKIASADEWMCFKCNPNQLSKLHIISAAVHEYSVKFMADAIVLRDVRLLHRDITACCKAPDVYVPRAPKRKLYDEENEDDEPEDAEPTPTPIKITKTESLARSYPSPNAKKALFTESSVQLVNKALNTLPTENAPASAPAVSPAPTPSPVSSPTPTPSPASSPSTPPKPKMKSPKVEQQPLMKIRAIPTALLQKPRSTPPETVKKESKTPTRIVYRRIVPAPASYPPALKMITPSKLRMQLSSPSDTPPVLVASNTPPPLTSTAELSGDTNASDPGGPPPLRPAISPPPSPLPPSPPVPPLAPQTENSAQPPVEGKPKKFVRGDTTNTGWLRTAMTSSAAHVRSYLASISQFNRDLQLASSHAQLAELHNNMQHFMSHCTNMLIETRKHMHKGFLEYLSVMNVPHSVGRARTGNPLNARTTPLLVTASDAPKTPQPATVTPPPLAPMPAPVLATGVEPKMVPVQMAKTPAPIIKKQPIIQTVIHQSSKKNLLVTTARLEQVPPRQLKPVNPKFLVRPGKLNWKPMGNLISSTALRGLKPVPLSALTAAGRFPRNPIILPSKSSNNVAKATSLAPKPANIGQSPPNLPQKSPNFTQKSANLAKPTHLPSKPTAVASRPTPIAPKPTVVASKPTAVASKPMTLASKSTNLAPTPTNVPEVKTSVASPPLKIAAVPAIASKPPPLSFVISEPVSCAERDPLALSDDEELNGVRSIPSPEPTPPIAVIKPKNPVRSAVHLDNVQIKIEDDSDEN